MTNVNLLKIGTEINLTDWLNLRKNTNILRLTVNIIFYKNTEK